MAAFLSGLIIAVVYYFTAPIAKIQRIKMKEQSMKELIPEAASFTPIQGKDEWYKAEKDGQLPDQKVIGFKVLSHKETPGLGDQAFKPKFADQFTGKGYQQLELVKIQEEGKITAVTGATITSRAVTNGIKHALIELEKFLNESK
jgi:electron transport complex protein RnfG